MDAGTRFSNILSASFHLIHYVSQHEIIRGKTHYKVKCKDYDAVTHHGVIREKNNYEMKWKNCDVLNYAKKEYAQKKEA